MEFIIIIPLLIIAYVLTDLRRVRRKSEKEGEK